MNYTEAELIAGCLRKDKKYQEALYNLYAPRMMGVCVRYAHTTFEAEDIFQDGFMRVYSCVENYNHTGSFEGWIKHIFTNAAINHFHRNKRHYYHQDISVSGADPAATDTNALENFQNEELLLLLNLLPAGYKLVFNLFAIDGFSHKEISKQLGISEGTSKSQLAKAKALLKKILSEKQREEEYARRY